MIGERRRRIEEFGTIRRFRRTWSHFHAMYHYLTMRSEYYMHSIIRELIFTLSM
jgi:hypothetical protein